MATSSHASWSDIENELLQNGGGGVMYGKIDTSLSDSHLGHCSQSLVGRSAPGMSLGRQDLRLHTGATELKSAF